LKFTSYLLVVYLYKSPAAVMVFVRWNIEAQYAYMLNILSVGSQADQ